VLLISIDSLRNDMPWNGYKRQIAPNLTRLHERAVSYRSGYSTSSFTSKSVAGLLGGKYPSEMPRTFPFFTRYHPENKMFCEALGEQGIPCAAGHAHAYFAHAGFEQGFGVWKLVPGIQFDAETDRHVTSDKLTPIAMEILGDAKLTEKPFFAWFHFMDPHDQYKPHAESPNFGRKNNKDLYDEEVFFTDLWVGKLVEWVEKQPWAQKTVMVFTADHGEAFMEHGLVRHAIELYEVLVHVPLFFVVPGQTPRIIDAPRSHIALAPTFLDLLGARPDRTFRGKSLKDELFGGSAEARDVVCDLPKDEFNHRRRSLLHDGWKIIAFFEDARFELYDIKNDPDEKTDVFAKERDKAKEMLALYKQVSLTIKDVPAK
jgi:arylsulfatase A-like enzyme